MSLAEHVNEPVDTAREDLSGVQERREALQDAADALEDAISAPVTEHLDSWWSDVESALAVLRSQFEHHVTTTEGVDGLFDDVMERAPRLARNVGKLRREHDEIHATLGALVNSPAPAEPDEAERLRETAVELLARLARHRYAGADLLYEAYNVDISESD